MTFPPRLPRFWALVVVAAALLVQFANAWSFQWRDDEGEATIEVGMDYQGCKEINLGENQPFEWDPKESAFCISLFRDKKCTSMAGNSCNPWVQDATLDLLAFEVNGTLTDTDDIFDTTTTTDLPTSTSTTQSMTTSVATESPATTSGPTSLPEGEQKDDNSGLSGGAIAGIVVGIVVAFLGGIVIAWIMFRRRRQTTQDASPAGYSPNKPTAPMSESGLTTTTATTVTATSGSGSAPPISKWGAPMSPTSPTEPLSAAPAYSAAPPEGTKLAELSESNAVVELQGSNPGDYIPQSRSNDYAHEKPAN